MILRGNKWLLGEINDFKGKWMILRGNTWNMMKKYQKDEEIDKNSPFNVLRCNS